MAGSIREMSSEMGDNHGNFDLFRLNSSVRIKTRMCAEVTLNRICANAHNSDNYETRLRESSTFFLSKNRFFFTYFLSKRYEKCAVKWI